MAKSVINKAIDNPIMNKTTSSDINSSEGDSIVLYLYLIYTHI